MKKILKPEAGHLRAMAHLAADAFSSGQYVDQFCENYIGNSHYDWNVARLALDGEKIIHHWGVWGYLMWVETVRLKVAGIGAVVTHPDYRQQGWMHQAAHSSFEAMRAGGYDLSILRGQHYARMGYARAWNYVTYHLKLEELPALEPRQPYQPLLPEQVGEMDALYNRTHAHFTGAAIRPTFRNRHPDDIGVFAWFGPQGQLEGYVRAMPAEDNPRVLQCLEAAGDPEQGLAVVRALFQRGDYEKLEFFTLPHLHPLLQQLRKGACIVENRYFDVSGWRVRLINLHSALQKLVPLFEQRLSQSRFADWQGSLLLDAGEQQAALQIERCHVKIGPGQPAENSLRAGPEAARFLIGSDEPEEIIRQAGLACSGVAVSLAQVLFPNLHPMLSYWDEY
jgi:hypothetical protein